MHAFKNCNCLEKLFSEKYTFSSRKTQVLRIFICQITTFWRFVLARLCFWSANTVSKIFAHKKQIGRHLCRLLLFPMDQNNIVYAYLTSQMVSEMSHLLYLLLYDIPKMCRVS